MSLVIGGGPTGLGDLLILTPICNQVEDVTIQLPNCARRFAPLFRGIAEVEIKDDIVPTLRDSGDGIYAQQKLNALGLSGSCIPKIKMFKEEIEWAEKFLSDYPPNVVALVANCSQKWAFKREMPQKDWEPIIKKIVDSGRTILQFGISENFSPLPSTIPILDLDIRKQAALFYVIRQYVGIDTGDYHLMLAVGGCAVVFVPQEGAGYNYSEWHYTEKYWQNGRNRVKYIRF